MGFPITRSIAFRMHLARLIKYVSSLGRHHNLRKFKELGDVRLLLVADILLHADLWHLTLNHRKRDAVDKQHNIRSGIVELVLTVHRKFLSDME